MPTLNLIRLKCIETETNNGADSAYLTVNDKKIWGPTKMNDAETKDLKKSHRFTHRATVRLYDKDSLDADDFLGSLTVTKADADGREQTHNFTEDDANYRLTYSVE